MAGGEVSSGDKEIEKEEAGGEEMARMRGGGRGREREVAAVASAMRGD